MTQKELFQHNELKILNTNGIAEIFITISHRSVEKENRAKQKRTNIGPNNPLLHGEKPQ